MFVFSYTFSSVTRPCKTVEYQGTLDLLFTVLGHCRLWAQTVGFVIWTCSPWNLPLYSSRRLWSTNSNDDFWENGNLKTPWSAHSLIPTHSLHLVGLRELWEGHLHTFLIEEQWRYYGRNHAGKESQEEKNSSQVCVCCLLELERKVQKGRNNIREKAVLKIQEKQLPFPNRQGPVKQVLLFLSDTGTLHSVCFIQNTKLITMELRLQSSLLGSFHDTPVCGGWQNRPFTFLLVCLYL